MLLQITLGDVIGWFITVASAVGVAVTVNISVKNNSRKYQDNRRVNQKGINTNGGDFTGGDRNGH